jgi:hypothetical protein
VVVCRTDGEGKPIRPEVRAELEAARTTAA